MSLRFEGPPPRRRGPQLQHEMSARALRERPGEWAVVTTRVSASAAASLAWWIRSARCGAYRPGGAWEAVARTVEGEQGVEHRVYARYVGSGPATTAAPPATPPRGTP